MEMIMKRKDNKLISIVMAIICVLCLIPTAVVFANAVTKQPTIGMSGVNNSGLTIGMTTLDNSSKLIDTNESQPSSLTSTETPFLIIIPLIFFLLALFLIMQVAFSEDKDFKKLVYAAILIFVALALLGAIQFHINGLF